MTTFRKSSQAICAVAALITATAAHAEPSEADIRRALQGELDKVQAVMAQMGGQAPAKRFASKLHSVKKLACSAVSARVVVCDVEADVTEGVSSTRSKNVASMRFVQASDGWRISK